MELLCLLHVLYLKLGQPKSKNFLQTYTYTIARDSPLHSPSVATDKECTSYKTMTIRPNKVQDFRGVFEKALSDIADRTEPAEERCLILSGGVDTCAILAAARRRGIAFHAAITVVIDDDSPDLAFALAAIVEHKNEVANHSVLRISANDLVKQYLPICVKSLHTFDGMTLRNSLVVAAAFHKAQELGYKHAIVGDGADELFGGYSFMWGCADDPDAWKKKRNDMCRTWTFATAALAEVYALEVHSPFMEPDLVIWALAETVRSDCIGTKPIRLVFGGEAVAHDTGKIILREAYDTVASWRRKDPIEVGSGVTIIGHDPHWNDVISDEDFAVECKQLHLRGFVIKNKEHLVNFRAFENVFGIDGENFHLMKRLPLGDGCAGCCFDNGDLSFCRLCGAWPSQRSAGAAS